MPADGEFAADILEITDDLEQINREYYMRGWTDGLPIIPPTEERVQRMHLPFPQDVLGRIRHAGATPPWKKWRLMR